MKRFKLEYEKGGILEAYLLEDAAPVTCQRFWEQLPAETISFHTRWSGKQISTIPLFREKPPMENQTIYLGKGDIAYWREWEGNYDNTGLEVFVSGYGAAHLDDMRGESRANLFARIDPAFWDDLVTIGLRIWQFGQEKIRISPISD